MADSDQRQHKRSLLEESDQLALGREAFGRKAWHESYRHLSLADEATSLGVVDLERLATASYLVGRDEDYIRVLERAHHAFIDRGASVRAARAAFWLGLRLAFRGEANQATGWFGRARRLLQREGKACVEEGCLLLPAAEQQIESGAAAAAFATAARAAEIGDQFSEADLSACARHVQGRAAKAAARICHACAETRPRVTQLGEASRGSSFSPGSSPGSRPSCVTSCRRRKRGAPKHA